ncbi:MAG: YrbL family protein [Bacteroidota bacterium]
MGKERACYVHPKNPGRVIKILISKVEKQTKRELKLYKGLQRKKISYQHIPKFHGSIETNLGKGNVFDLIQDFNGDISKSLLDYLKLGYSLLFFEPKLIELKNYLLTNKIIFNHDMYAGNILYQKISESTGHLILIDGLGDTVFIPWLNIFPLHVKQKIERRWDLFIRRLHVNHHTKVLYKDTIWTKHSHAEEGVTEMETP